jgi:hypothetical protein
LVRDLIQEGGGCLNHRSPHGETQPLPPANWPDLICNTANIRPHKEKDFGAKCVLWKTEKWGQN